MCGAAQRRGIREKDFYFILAWVPKIQGQVKSTVAPLVRLYSSRAFIVKIVCEKM